jgi:hypothetical protein
MLVLGSVLDPRGMERYAMVKRLARILLLLAHFGKEGTPETVVPKIVRRCWRK